MTSVYPKKLLPCPWIYNIPTLQRFAAITQWVPLRAVLHPAFPRALSLIDFTCDICGLSFPKCSSMASVWMTSSDNAGFVPGLFSWPLAFQCSCFDKQYRNAFFHAPRGRWVLVFSEESGVHFLYSLSPRETSVSNYFPLSPADVAC